MKEIIGMKLSDALCKIPDDKIICIGAATGFVFCGKKEQFLEDENLISQKLIDNAKFNMKQYESKILNRCNECLNGKCRMSDMKSKIKIIMYTFKIYTDNLKYILSFTDLKNRIVKDAYLRLHKNGIVILVEGKEKGTFWDEDEYSEWRRTEGGCI